MIRPVLCAVSLDSRKPRASGDDPAWAGTRSDKKQ